MLCGESGKIQISSGQKGRGLDSHSGIPDQKAEGTGKRIIMKNHIGICGDNALCIVYINKSEGNRLKNTE